MGPIHPVFNPMNGPQSIGRGAEVNRVSKLKVNNNRVVQTFTSWTGGRQGDFGSSSSGSLHLQAKDDEETRASVSPFGKKTIFKMISALG